MPPLFSFGVLMNTASALQLVQDINQVRRKARRPVHKHLVEYRPFQLQPFFIAPVLPGETLKELNAQCRVISDPLKGGADGVAQLAHLHVVIEVLAPPREDVASAAFQRVGNHAALRVQFLQRFARQNRGKKNG